MRLKGVLVAAVGAVFVTLPGLLNTFGPVELSTLAAFLAVFAAGGKGAADVLKAWFDDEALDEIKAELARLASVHADDEVGPGQVERISATAQVAGARAFGEGQGEKRRTLVARLGAAANEQDVTRQGRARRELVLFVAKEIFEDPELRDAVFAAAGAEAGEPTLESVEGLLAGLFRAETSQGIRPAQNSNFRVEIVGSGRPIATVRGPNGPVPVVGIEEPNLQIDARLVGGRPPFRAEVRVRSMRLSDQEIRSQTRLARVSGAFVVAKLGQAELNADCEVHVVDVVATDSAEAQAWAQVGVHFSP
jgi:hypothetical protein